MAAAVAVLALTAYLQGGSTQLWAGLEKGLILLLQVAPLIIIAFTLTGFVQVLIDKDVIRRWLGHEAGLRGIFLGAFAGALVPGGPYVFYPLAASFLAAGADIGTLIAFVAAKNLWSLTRIPMEIALLGPTLTWVRFAVTFAFPILAGFLAHILFHGLGDVMRQEVRERSGLK